MFSLEISAAIAGTDYGTTFGDRLERSKNLMKIN
jgi:hypothetical protein